MTKLPAAWLRSIILSFSVLTLLFSSACAELSVEETESFLRTSLRSVRKKVDFQGYCGSCTAYQLSRAGLFYSDTLEGDTGYNGNQCYEHYKTLSPVNGMSVSLFPAEGQGGSYTIEEVCRLLNASNRTGKETYTMFCFSKGSHSDAGQQYGHVLLVHAVYNGMVYWGESYGDAYRVDTIENFVYYYRQYSFDGKDCRVFDGAIAYDYYPNMLRLPDRWSAYQPQEWDAHALEALI